MLNNEKINAMREQLKTGIQVISAPQLFPTPVDLAQRMSDITLEPDSTEHGRSWKRTALHILEPSAGTGQLIGALGASWYPCGKMVAVEINSTLVDRLKIEFPLTNVLQGDFLLCSPEELGYFDRVIMNPPFVNGSDIKHITHAVKFLKPGGRLVALCANGPRQQSKLKPLAEDSGGYYEPLPSGTFSAQGTSVNVALLIIEG